MVFEPFWSEMGIDFEHFGLKLDMVIRGTFMKAYKPGRVTGKRENISFQLNFTYSSLLR